MQQVSATYLDLAARDDSRRECRLTVLDAEGDTVAVFDEDRLVSMSLSHDVFSGSEVTPGACVAGEFAASLLPYDGDWEEVTIPRMAELVPAVRLVNGAMASEWITQGHYYIDTRETDTETRVLKVKAYDAMLKAEQAFLTTGPQGTWPMLDEDVVAEICTRIGVDLDSRTALDKGYFVQYPSTTENNSESYTMREVLGYIGAMYGGCWIITPVGELRLIKFYDLPQMSYLVSDDYRVLLFGEVRIVV